MKKVRKKNNDSSRMDLSSSWPIFCTLYMDCLQSRASSTSEFYVAGKGVNPVVNGMATAADWMSAASFLSMAGLIAFMGKDGAIYLMGWTGGYVLLALLLAPYLRKFGKYTVPEFIGERYYSDAARVVAVLPGFYFFYLYSRSNERRRDSFFQISRGRH